MGEGVEPIYVDLASESDDPHVTIIESLCLRCQEMGTTRLLMTRIPHFREVILTSFDCSHCGHHNTGFQPGRVQELGVRYELAIKEQRDLSRQIVKSDHAIFSIPEVELEIPGDGEKGEVTTVEGIIRRTIEGLNQDQSARRLINAEVAEQIEIFMDKLTSLLSLEEPFTIVVDDTTGNSFVENPFAPKPDPQLQKKNYRRTPEQNMALGLQEVEPELTAVQEAEEEEAEGEGEVKEEGKGVEGAEEEEKEDIKNEVLSFSTLCDRCSKPVETKMKVTQIPYFQEVIIMATHCESCGNRTNEVKSGSGINEKGKKISLKITDPTDMARDVLKSETCTVEIPEFDLYIGSGILGGKFTTLEGLLTDIREDLKSNPFLSGDSSQSDRRAVMEKLTDDLTEVINGELQVTITMDDPAGNSYLQNVYAPDDDPEMTIEEYERTFDQNESLGLNDMKTENYEEDTVESKAVVA
ncbi:zinc finger protein ZPR1-like [Penaeus japonicus]|uniref:zinc finger protein ZPR1-like n=1 Tax=Penaeus japonicus TaxID=27405 RepID=UPI001C714A02|nr:zinc finger protein ZPR1-like [Penaeus japonicus]XP_042871384.1 zinc finger protein ZPR1-like [Penaeus japonicus]XP_042871386.1 zinc finger protein ZPR1-like [Penaeus japonicus]